MVLKLLDQASPTQTDHMQHENPPKFQEEKQKMKKFNTKKKRKKPTKVLKP